MSIEVGSVVEGKVTGITSFGAFIDLGNGQTGLVHISEVADDYVQDINNYLKINDVVKVRVLSMKDGKIGLSIRKVDSVNKERSRRSSNGNTKNQGQPDKNFESKLLKFLKDSEARQKDLKKNQDSKRGGRGSARISANNNLY
ncbi:MAG: S1 RNA-binding domain-containing protein [Bacillota bacterium]|jgi:S1 RNA binding domain protein|nr:S1 RNA-binding domain-containing protein [Bacillota bacterium]NLU55226.1 S1 RNA-binding domain-containing protein [Bacillota bacterium]HOA91648.1 S1 RNA-binding domain-containing protein [Bacillota bacterium]HOJ46014.1 S1 RNA-binding domain-containing protein [Bacillota bacterium]HOP54356.1 S1 RNA-binding domain-containing protein [Bacillota bacterium]